MAHLKTLIKLPPKRNTIPVLGLVKFENGFLTATDIDFYLHVKAEDMAHRLKDKTLYDPLSLANELFDIESDIPATDFPEMGTKGEVAATVTMDKDFIPLLEWVLKAASTEAARYYLNGVYFDPEGQVVATDGHRLHCFEHKLKHTAKAKKDQKGYIIPRTDLRLALSLLKETNIDKFDITFYDNARADFHIGDHLLESKLIDGTFPAWRRAVPKHRKKTKLNPEEWKNIVKDAMLLKRISGIDKLSKPIAVSITAGEATFKTYIESQPFKTWKISTDTKVTIGFNAKYAAAQMPGDCYYGDTTDPIVIKGSGVVPTLGILMPMRV